ncbi:class I SAM-dependent methyltransferase [Roseovarius phycicola]|uniref:SAM-dependent methyltransferase n=1 Tax=Roseovarius phycicola TaxID=3080976 RepID=A0ABZ2HHH9_9RHOB
MTALGDILKAQIAATGPMRLDAFLAACLMHPEHGYYTTRDPFGTAGDFTTAPEISQMFGELIGLCLAQTWTDQGAPNPFALAELGPGRGTLMVDLLRATKGIPGFHEAIAGIHLVESSPALRKRQAESLKHADTEWQDTAETLPDMPLFTVANEFFDALPIRQFQRGGDGWSERMVGLTNDQFAFGLGPVHSEDKLAHRLEDTKEGDLVEIAPAASGIITALSQRIAAHGGAALIIDYGDWRSLGDTLQAVHGHDTTTIFDAPGEADLSAHVDFEALAHAATDGCRYSRVTPQGVFLERLGITARAQTLAQSMTGDSLDAHIAAHRRLTHPEEMGTLFKVMALYPEAAAPPPGLDA